MGVDVREHGYGFISYPVPASGAPKRLSTNKRWMITRIQAWASDTLQLTVNLEGQTMNIAPEGCGGLEPNGAYRGDVLVDGEGGLIVIEFWFQTDDTGQAPAVVIT